MSHLILCALGCNLLFVPCVHTGFGSHSFSAAAPIIWNSLPLDIRNSSTVSRFAANLKPSFTKQLSGLLSAPSHPPAHRLRLGWPVADTVRFTNYVLTYLLY